MSAEIPPTETSPEGPSWFQQAGERMKQRESRVVDSMGRGIETIGSNVRECMRQLFEPEPMDVHNVTKTLAYAGGAASIGVLAL